MYVLNFQSHKYIRIILTRAIKHCFTYLDNHKWVYGTIFASKFDFITIDIIELERPLDSPFLNAFEIFVFERS